MYSEEEREGVVQNNGLSVHSAQPSPLGREQGWGWGAGLPTLSEARDLLGVAGREEEPRDL